MKQKERFDEKPKQEHTEPKHHKKAVIKGIHIQYRFDQEIRNVLEYCSSVPAAETEESAV